MGYATSAQALELLASDWKEAYTTHARIFRKRERVTTGVEVACGISSLINAGMYAGDILAGRNPWIAGLHGILLGVNLYAVKFMDQTRRWNRDHAQAIEQVVTDWDRRDTEHPLQIVSIGAMPLIGRHMPAPMRERAQTIASYDTAKQLMESTDENCIGLVNAVVIKSQSMYERMPNEIRELLANKLDDEKLELFNGMFSTFSPEITIPELDITIPGVFPVGLDRALLIGHNKNGRYCHHHSLPAVETDTYYNNRRRAKVQPAEAAKGLLWAPSPAQP